MQVGMKKEDNAARLIGFWSSMFATLMAVLFLVALVLTFLVFKLDLNWQGIEQFAQRYNEAQIMSFVVPCFLLAPTFLTMMVCLYRITPEGRKTLALLALVFAVVYASQISYNYFMQMSSVRMSVKAGLLEGLTPFAFGNLNSTFWSLEVLGYTFLSLSLIFSGLLFRGGRLKAAVRWIFLVNGIWGVWAMVEQVLSIQSPPISLMVFAVSFPVSTAMIGVLFLKGAIFSAKEDTAAA